MSMQGRPTRSALAVGSCHRAPRRRDPLARLDQARRGRGRHHRLLAGPDQGRAPPLADRAGTLGRRNQAARGQPDRRVGLARRHRERQGPPRGGHGRPARRGGHLGRRQAGRRHALVRLRPRPAEDRGRPDRPSPAGSRSGPSRGASCSRPTARRPTWRWAWPTRWRRSISSTLQVTARVAVGREPRGIALSPDGSLLLVGNARSQDVSVVSTRIDGRLPDDPDRGGQPAAGGHQRRRQAGLRRQHAEPRVRDDLEQHRPGLGAGPAADARRSRRPASPFATLSLDPRGKAAADAHGVADRQAMASSWPSAWAELTKS